MQCDVTGVIPDAMTVMGKISNYTMAYHAYSIARIGTAPLEFPANASGKWGGLFGTVFNEEYQLSITFWNNRQPNNQIICFYSFFDENNFIIDIKSHII